MSEQRFADDKVHLKRDDEFPDAKLPTYGSTLASGMDVYAAKKVVLKRFEPVIAPSGWLLAYLAPDLEIQVRSRSGNTLKRNFFVANQPGTVDADYRGKIGVILLYMGPDAEHVIEKHEKIAQLVVAPVKRLAVEVSETLHDTTRGAGGFGSTGR